MLLLPSPTAPTASSQHHLGTAPVVLTEQMWWTLFFMLVKVFLFHLNVYFHSQAHLSSSHTGFVPAADSRLITIMTPVGSIFSLIQQPREAAVP